MPGAQHARIGVKGQGPRCGSERERLMIRNIARTLLSACLVLALVPVAAWGGTAASDEDVVSIPDDAVYVEGELVVVYDDAADGSVSTLSSTRVESKLDAQGIEVDDVLAEAHSTDGTMVLATYDESSLDIEQAIAAAESVAGVAYAQPNYVYGLLEDAEEDETTTTLAVTDDPATSVSDASVTANQYYLYGDELDTTGTKGANVIDAWDYVTCSGTDVTIVVLDTGVNLEHEDLVDNLLADYCYDFYNDKALEVTSSFNGDYYGHGTHVCGIAAATANNATGIAGASYNASVIAYKVFDDSTSSPSALTSTIVSAYDSLIELVEDEGVNIRVANMSLGGYGSATGSSDKALLSNIEEARELGVLTVCAGGNGSGNTPYTDNQYPSDWDACLAVTALDTDGTNAVWSDFNEEKDISAPGVKIYATYNAGTASYVRMSGTSMASPLVAGIAALLFAANPDATVDDVVEAIESTADEIDDSDDSYSRNSTGYGGVVSGSAGAINAKEAVLAITEATITVPDDFTTLYRTQSVQLSVTLEGATGESAGDIEWTWSVEDGTGSATIDASGVLTAVTAGTVTATVEGTGPVTGRTYSATRTITIAEIALADAPTASTGYASAITIAWGEATAATGYYVQRSDEGADEFATLAEVDAAEAVDGELTYEDATAVSGVVYDYRIVPYGTLDGEVLEGAASDVASGLRFDMVTTLASQLEVTQQLLAFKSMNGGYTDTVFIVSEQDDATAITAAGLAGVEEAAFLTIGAEGITEDVEQALQLVDPYTVRVVSSDNVIDDEVIADIEDALPSATVSTYEFSDANYAGEKMYTLGKGSWSSTAFIISGDESYLDDALSVAAYAYAADAAVFTTNSSGKLSVTTRGDLLAGVFTDVVIVGDEEAVGTSVEEQVTKLGIDYVRISGETLYDTSALLAAHGTSVGDLSDDVYYFAPADYGTCLSAVALAGYSGCPLLVIDEDAEDVLASYVQQGTADAYTPVVYFNLSDGAALSDDEKARILDYVQGSEDVDVWLSTDVALADVAVEAIAAQTYTGAALEPALTLTTADGTVLVEGEDYTAAYADNVDVGTASVTVTGLGSYRGTLELSFEVVAASIADATLELEADSVVYTGAALEPAVTVTRADGTLLVEGTDYTLVYADNTAAGTARVTVTGCCNYTDSASASFEIAPASIEDASVEVAGAVVYTGAAIEPAVTVTTADGTLLVEGEDYALAYSDNTAPGTALVTVTGCGNYTASADASFRILFADVTDESAWYYESVYAMADLGLITGYTSGESAGCFGVGDSMTRRDLAVILWRHYCPEEYASYVADGYESTTAESVCSGISDATYWTAAADWCVANGIIEGYERADGSRYFKPSGTITLEQLAQVLANINDGVGDTSVLASYKDGSSVASWARSAVAWAVEAGLAGQGTTKLSSSSSIARERVATVLWRALEAELLG